jgi:hypothetical protein
MAFWAFLSVIGRMLTFLSESSNRGANKRAKSREQTAKGRLLSVNYLGAIGVNL